MKTQVDLVNRVLGLLGVIQVGQAPSAEDADLVRGYIAGKMEELARRQVFYLQDIEQIDEEYFLPLAKIIANAVGPEVAGVPYSADVDEREEYRLRDIDRRPAQSPVLRTEFI